MSVLVGGVLLASGVSCGKAPAQKAPFLDQTKTLEPSQEWNREVVCINPAPVRFLVSGEGPMSVTFLTKAARDAMIRRDMAALKQEGMILSEESEGPDYDRTLELKPGSYFIIIRNNLKRTTGVRLQCFDLGK